MVDEAQDLSPLNHIMIQRTAAGRLIIVGDPKQAIYAFRGADSDSMQKLRKLRPRWIDLPLATTFRCPKVVVDRQQAHAPGFTAYQTNILGAFQVFSRFAPEPHESQFNDFQSFEVAKANWKDRRMEPQTWDWKRVQALHPNGHIAVLCRNNAPLLAVAFRLLRGNVGVSMLGRDIGKSLIALSKKILSDDEMPAEDCVSAINQWGDSQIALARANGHEEKVATLYDQRDCLLAVVEGAKAKTAAEIRWYLTTLFERTTGTVTLGTIHRSKGLEWDTVLHLDPWRIPSKFAQQNLAQLRQEINLKYVCETRTKKLLIEANLEDFE
jgi:superfamily I DNA/RNA helicase